MLNHDSAQSAGTAVLYGRGGVPEWLKGTGCKPVGYAYVGSNPTPSTIIRRRPMRGGMVWPADLYVGPNEVETNIGAGPEQFSGRRIKAITPAFQAGDAGSIPVIRSAGETEPAV